ncbi:MAG: flippase [Oscillospiraceae bacterium]|nr:flippase [Oscillospiraceae bacterium]MBQ8612569.1 flippase [Oscillospiraceae bacterium]
MKNGFLRSHMAQNASWIIIGQIYQMVLTFLVGIFSARYLGPSNYGLINYAASLVTLFTAICTLGTENILVNELVSRPEKEGVVCGTVIRMRLLSSLLSVILLTLLAQMMNPDEPLTVYITALYSTTLLVKSFDSLNLWFQAKLLSKVTAGISAAAFTAVSAYKVYLLVTQKSVIWFAASNVIQFAIVSFLLVVFYYRHNGRQHPLVWDGKLAKELFSRSYHFVLSGMMVAVYGQMDKIMLKGMLDETAVGIYTAGSSISEMWIFILGAIVTSARPVILEKFRTDREKYEKMLTGLYAVVIGCSVAVALVLSLSAKLVIWILYGEAYAAAKSVLRILTWSTAFSYMGVVRGIWVVPNEKQRYEKYIAASGAVCNLLLNCLLIPSFGANGAAVATLASQAFTNFIVGFLIKEIRYNNVLIVRSFFLPFKMLKECMEGRKKNGN